MRVLFLPSSLNGKAPVDRRRFLGFAKSCEKYEVVYDPADGYDMIFCAGSGDINLALKLRNEKKPLIFDYANHYLIEEHNIKNYLRTFYFSISKKHSFKFKTYIKSLKEIIDNADLVICSSIIQKRYLQSNLSPNKVLVLTDFFEYDFPELFQDNLELTNLNKSALFWEGQAENLMNFKVINSVSVLNDTFNIVTDNTYRSSLIKKRTNKLCDDLFKDYNFHEWSRANVLSASYESSIGILPIDKSIGIYSAKPENKLVLMYLLGLPTLVTCTLSYETMCGMAGTENWLVNDDEDWGDKLDNARCLSTEHFTKLCQHIRSFALQNYSTENLSNMWLDAFEFALNANTLPA